MPNIQFNYLYRDGSNYKNFGFVIFRNVGDLSLQKAEELIRSKLISGEFFVASEWCIPDLHFNKWIESQDHG